MSNCIGNRFAPYDKIPLRALKSTFLKEQEKKSLIFLRFLVRKPLDMKRMIGRNRIKVKFTMTLARLRRAETGFTRPPDYEKDRGMKPAELSASFTIDGQDIKKFSVISS